MGHIVNEVRNGHLEQNPDELSWVKAFQSDFDITWASGRRAHNSNYSVYFLRPSEATKETFGFDQEIMLIYSKYPTIEARTFQSIEQFFNDDPARGRVDRLFAILVSEAKDPSTKVMEYAATNEARTIAVFSAEDLRNNTGDGWYVRNIVASQVFSRDLFDFRLPLERDTYFFGRAPLMHSFKDSVKRGENRGLFGLRKTGKTSFLYKLRRDLEEDKATIVLFYDCKSPSIRQRTWSELLEKIIVDLSEMSGISSPVPQDSRFLAEAMAALVSKIPEGKRVLIIFDEVEYISSFSQTDAHWHRDYLHFWQSIWAAQSQTRKLSAILSGVNPKLVEVDKIDKVQNPLFGIVPYNYLTGLARDELRRMLQTLGKRMGMKFTVDASDAFMLEYGGHPLLCRLAASYTHKELQKSNSTLPVQISSKELASKKAERDAGLIFYCGHVISELREFYPDEYQVFELLAQGQMADYLQFATIPEYRVHLESYGLVSITDRTPQVAIPVVGTHVALEAARREGRQTIQRLVPLPDRADWLRERVEDINLALNDLHRTAVKAGLPPLFGPNSYPESHRFMSLEVAQDIDELQSFLNVCNRCFVESIETFGKSIGDEKYFWTSVKSKYKSLHRALHRIKVYRHNEFHLQLTDATDDVYRAFLRQDLEGRDPTSVDELAFTLQQSVLDSLWNGVQLELSRYGT